MTAAKARLHPEIWLTARHGICTRIIGYQTLVEQGNKAAADHIATSADTCNNILYWHACIYHYYHLIVFDPTHNVFDVTVVH